LLVRNIIKKYGNGFLAIPKDSLHDDLEAHLIIYFFVIPLIHSQKSLYSLVRLSYEFLNDLKQSSLVLQKLFSLEELVTIFKF